jgi:hypothetical protein
VSEYAGGRLTIISRGSRGFATSEVAGAAATKTFDSAATMTTDMEVVDFTVRAVTEVFLKEIWLEEMG